MTKCNTFGNKEYEESREDEEKLALREELDYFIRLSQAQAEQIEGYKSLLQRSHKLVESLTKSQTTKDKN